MTDTSIWNKEIDVPATVISYVDEGVRAKFPPNDKVVGIMPSGSSYWARTAKIETANPDGEEVSYFIKVHQGEKGERLVHGEFEAMTTLYNNMPELVPRPIGWGAYTEMEDIYFFVCEFREMTDDIPDLDEFVAIIVEMHQRGANPGGKFGFPYEVFAGNSSQVFPMCDTWEETFKRNLDQNFAQEEKSQGYDEDMAFLRKAMYEKVIPRLLRPLATGGRTLVPRITHGDLWHGNVGVDVKTNRPVIFDSTAVWAHNEYELGPWRPIRHKIGQNYIREYLRLCPASEPKEDFDDRNLLYCIRFDLMSSSLYPGNLRFRNIVRDECRQLVDKYPGGYEDFAKEHGLEP